MELKYSDVERNGHVTIVRIRRPEVYNALHLDADLELTKVFDEFSLDPDQWVAIITGTGDRAFCAGKDLKWAAAGGRYGGDNGAGFGGLCHRFDCDKPVIAAVNGYAMGGGFELALSCDLIIASETAVFGLPEPRVGTAALGTGIVRLSREIGTKKAMEIILTGRSVTAQEGYELGFVNEVTLQGQALLTAERWAGAICKNAPLSIRASKQVLMRGWSLALDQSSSEQCDYPAVQAMMQSLDYIEGAHAFAAKRQPNWLGR